MSSQKHVTRAAGVVGASTVVTRILGFLRDMAIASMFGAGLETDAYFVAFRIPSMLRRLVGEGALTVAFIPVFVEQWQQDHEQAWKLANTVITLLALILLGITALGLLFTPFFVTLIAPGFDKIPGKFELTTTLTRITFPYIFFISLAALAMGILNSLRHFLSSALAPAMLNLSLIGAVLFVCPHLPRPVIGLGVGVLLGGVTQLAFQIPALLQRGFRFHISFDYRNPAVQKVGKLMLPAFFGLAVNQITLFVNTILASYLDEGSVSYLYYANRVMEFPLGIFGMAIATAVLPTMASQSAKQEFEQLMNTLSFALRLVLFITIPSMVGLIVLRVPIITFLFQRREFTLVDTHATAQTLLYYAVGLAAIASVRIVVPVFYSLQDTKTPVKCGAIALVVNILCALALIRPLQYGGLALATSLASFANLFLLIWFLYRRLGHISIAWKEIILSLSKTGLASIIMGIACWPFVAVASHALWGLFLVILGGVIVFLGCVLLLRTEELSFLIELLSKQKIPGCRASSE